MQVQPIDLNTVEVDGQKVPVKGPDCRKCPRLPVCDIYKTTAKFFAEIYPTLKDVKGNLLPPEKQIHPFELNDLARICKYYAGLDVLPNVER
jgi:hypothetical protein